MTKSKYSASPPSSRLPPDGHEFPSSNYEELIYPCDSSASSGRKLSHSGTRFGVPAAWRNSSTSTSNNNITTNNNNNNSRSDERSESSVKDKIALFTKEEKKPVKILEDSWRFFGILKSFWGFLRILENFWGLLVILKDSWEFLRFMGILDDSWRFL